MTVVTRVRRRAAVAAALLAATVVPWASARPVAAQASQPEYAELTGAAVNVNGTYTPLVGNFVGNDDADDILWYAPGSGPETLWRGTADVTEPFAKVAVSAVNGTYVPIVGDFSGDLHDDVLWYGPGSAPDTLWNFTDAGLITRRVTINGTFTPIVLPNAAYPDSIFWYAPGTATDWLWVFEVGGGSHTSAPYVVNSRFTPIAGDFGDDSLGDLLWYAPGTGGDVLWTRTAAVAAGSFAATPLAVNGTYSPVVGDFGTGSSVYADSTADIAWLTETGTDQLWNRTGGSWSKGSATIPGPKAVRVPRPGSDRLITWGGSAADRTWQYLPSSGFSTRSTGLGKLASDVRPIVGRFGAGADEAVLWYRPGAGAERFWLPLMS